MGQPINVVKKPGSEPDLVRFETNRVLTGMGHERYRSLDDVLGKRTVDELARRLFETGDVQMVHASGSVVTVQLATESAEKSSVADDLLEVIRGLHIHYPGHEESAPDDAAEISTTG